jgi:3-dehydroquinate synthase/shikimate kinase/3-dehydroquinate synthase
LLKKKDYLLINNHIESSNLPNEIKKYFKVKDLNKILSFMLKDKKNNSNKISLVLLKSIASPIIKKEYDKKKIKTFLKSQLIN